MLLNYFILPQILYLFLGTEFIKWLRGLWRKERERGRRSEEAVVPLQKIDREAIFFF